MNTPGLDLSRVVIVGNSGSGKSWLAQRMAAHTGAAHVDLDGIHWLPGGFTIARERDVALGLLHQAAAPSRWVIEGIYGSLVQSVQAQATFMVWLCLDDEDCVANIRARGVRRDGTDASLAALCDWAASYRTRQGSSSCIGHATLFEQHAGAKVILRSREAVSAFAQQLIR